MMPLHQFYLALFVVLVAPIVPTAFAVERFSGSAKLAPNPTQTSANQRFALAAELQPANAQVKTTADGRFSVSANLTAPKSALTACGPLTEAIFKNGFEN